MNKNEKYFLNSLHYSLCHIMFYDFQLSLNIIRDNIVQPSVRDFTYILLYCVPQNFWSFAVRYIQYYSDSPYKI